MNGNDQSTPSSSHPLLAGWNESYGFRETFLSLFTQPGHATALTLVTVMLHEYAMEQSRHWPDPGESTARRELLAAAADLRWLAGFLAAVGKEREQSTLAPADRALSALAAAQAVVVNRVAETLRRAAGEP